MYVLVLLILLKKSFREGTCYKLMINLALYDMTAIVITSLLTGYFWIIGANYCTNSNLNYISGGLAMGLWAGSCLTCFILALNRVLDIWNRRIRHMLFKGRRIYAMLTLPFLYCNFFFFFTPPLLFNSDFTTWSFIPFTNLHDKSAYLGYAHIANNVTIMIFTGLLYIVYSRVFFQSFSSSSIVSKYHKSYIMQTSSICTVNLFAGLIYVYMELAPFSCWFPGFGHFLWIFSHGTPALVYLIMNRSIQIEALNLLRISSKVNTNSSTVVETIIIKVIG